MILACIPFTAYASFDEQDINYGNPRFVTIETFREAMGISQNYIFANCSPLKYSDSWGTDRHNDTSFYYKLPDNCTYTFDNGYYVISNEGSSMGYQSAEWHYDEQQDRLISDGWSTGVSDVWTASPRTIKIKSDLSEIIWGDQEIHSSEIIKFEYKIGDLEDKYHSVKVAFHPALSGNVNREVNDGDTSSMISKLKMYVKNYGSSPVQYSMAIYEKNSSTFRNGDSNPDIYFGDDPVFCYYSNDWVYGVQDEDMRSSEGALWTNLPVEYNKPSPWHYLASRSTDSVTFNFSQINLKQGVEYTVIVNVVSLPTDYDHATLIGMDSDISAYTVDFNTKETVYQSDFVMLQYDDIVYDPDDNSNGVLPYDGYSGNGQANVYDGSYNAYGFDGQYFYEGKTGSRGNNNGSSLFPSNSNTKYNTVLSQSSSVFSFFSVILSYFPSDIWIVLNIALWTGLIVFIVRRLR